MSHFEGGKSDAGDISFEYFGCCLDYILSVNDFYRSQVSFFHKGGTVLLEPSHRPVIPAADESDYEGV